MAFRIGQMVVCIDDDWRVPGGLKRFVSAEPKKGCIYTIREIVDWSDDCGLRFVEIVNPDPRPLFSEAEFSSLHFRPLTERKNDGEAFVEQLKRDCIPSPMKVKEREGVE